MGLTPPIQAARVGGLSPHPAAFSMSFSSTPVAIRKNMHGFAEIYETIRSKIGKEEYVVKLEPSKEEVVSSRKMEYALYAAGAVTG